MVRVHLGLETKPKPDDAADALAVAITCGFLYGQGQNDEHKFSNSRGRKMR
jgi:Holliday junction resolvasome RuvABC endonuclease subunit